MSKRFCIDFKTIKGTPSLLEYTDVLVRTALCEDIGDGDLTTKAIVNPKLQGVFEVVAKEDLVISGLFVADKVFKRSGKGICFESALKDGDRVKNGEKIATVSGSVADILVGERVALNFLQRLSGISTLTRVFVDKVSGTGAKILDTRKTTPCLRLLEKYAVKAGGGHNHRFGLFDCILIKDNHIVAAGGVAKAIKLVDKKYKKGILIEAEVKTFVELKEALSNKADIIMLDNMPVERVKKAMKIIAKKAIVEVSGGVNLSNVANYAKAGVDFISIGALTHSARSMDISMELVSTCTQRSGAKTRK